MILKVYIDTGQSRFLMEESYSEAIEKCKSICKEGIEIQVEGAERKYYYPPHRIKEIELIEDNEQ